MTMLKAYPLSEGWRPLPGVIWERRATIVPPHRTDDYLIDNAGAPRYFALVEYSEGPQDIIGWCGFSPQRNI